MGDQDFASIEGELKLILHRLEEISANQHSQFAELKTRISAIEDEGRKTAVWMGKTEQKIENIESDLDEHGSGTTAIAKAAIGLAGSAIGIVGTLVASGVV